PRSRRRCAPSASARSPWHLHRTEYRRESHSSFLIRVRPRGRPPGPGAEGLTMSTAASPLKDRRGRKYIPAIGSRLKPLLWIVLIGFALLGANGVYLASITALTSVKGISAQTPFYLLMVALHLILGFALLGPFLVFGFAHLFTSWKRPNKV